jgi:hypothetical protein
MLTLILAKAADPITLVLGLIGGWFSRAWIYAAFVAAGIATAAEIVINGSLSDVDTLFAGFLATLVWTSFGFLLKNRKYMVLGNHLTKMTNWMEAIEQTRHTMPIGAGGGIDSLPQHQQTQAVRDLEAGMIAAAKFPPFYVTAALVKNQQMALQLGRHVRVTAIDRLLERLVERNIALGPEDFQRAAT